MKRFATMLAVLSIAAGMAFAQAAAPSFTAGVLLGTDVITDASGNNVSWNSLGFQPDVGLGPFGVGLDLTLRFHIMPSPDVAFEVYPGDWVPDYEGSGKNFLDLYLPKILYVRYGHRGEPLFAKLGSIDDLTLGNGFIVGNYSNMRFLPEQRIFGLSFGLDGTLFNFPYIGLELLTGNLARFDVLGGRLFIRPLIGTGIPILKNLQIGGTYVMDRLPELYLSSETGLEPVSMYGADIFLPIISGQAFPLAAFAEMAFQPNERSGFMIGAGGKLIGMIVYGAQLRVLGPGFIPVYFDANYDVFRAVKADLMQDESDAEGFAGWLAKAGFSLFEDKISFDVSVDGPFKPIPATADPDFGNPAAFPHLRGVAKLGEGLIGGFFVDFSYEKYNLGKEHGFFADLIDPTDAVITAAVNYKTGAAVFTLLYNLVYNPENPDGFDITSSLSSSIKF